MPMNPLAEYVHALVNSHRLGSQVAAHRRIPGQGAQTEAQTQWIEDPLCEPVRVMLAHLGLDQLYRHQTDAITAIRHGLHTVVATPTASGKTLIYNVPIFDAIAQNRHVRALYISPLKALAQDQMNTFNQWSERCIGLEATAAIYDGDTSAYRRTKIRQHPPHVVMTNPEMVHLALLPYHDRWHAFFHYLQFVVIDEVHTYSGMLGAHMAQLIRRLRRICDLYGADPTFVFTSATIANPGQIASQLTGLPVHTIDRSGAPQGSRHWVLIDPHDSPARTAILLLKAALARQLRTIVYVQSRKLAELMAIWVKAEAGEMAERISVYRAGLTPSQRRTIEGQLKSGELLAVIGTSALELGIDIGHLDLCILVGYPGSIISTWQRGGRVGRRGQEAAIVLIAAEDALDKYFMSHPDALWHARPEPAVINPENEVALDAHLECAAAELPLKDHEAWLAESAVSEALARLERTGALRRTADGQSLHASRKRPHRFVHLRGAGQRYRIVNSVDGETIGEVDQFRLYREMHPGAVYLHQGKSHLVQRIDTKKGTIFVKASRMDYHTRVHSDSDVEIIEIDKNKYINNTISYYGKLKVTEQVTGYKRVRTSTGKSLGYHPLHVPPETFYTKGIWFDLPVAICKALSGEGFDLLGSLHAAEHAAISIIPLLVLADRNDIGGLSTSFHPQTNGATIFIYDGVPGGAGFCAQAFDQASSLLERSAEAIRACGCDSGCPACVHSPKCGSGNDPMDKYGALQLLERLGRPDARPRVQSHRMPAKSANPSLSRSSKTTADSKSYGVFDLETQKSAAEVGGWHQVHLMKVSCGVVYDAAQKEFVVYTEERIDQLIEHLRQFDQVVGFNSRRFDYRVLSGYSDHDFSRLPTVDLLELVHNQLGFRLSLNHLAQETLHVQKGGSGLDALKWWKEGRLDKIIEYCRKDVRITRDLFLYARSKGYLLYRQKDDGIFRVPIQI